MSPDRPPTLLSCFALIIPYLAPPTLAAVALTCKPLRRLSALTTAARAADAAHGLEPFPIPFLNPHSPHPYSYFLYTPCSILPPASPAQPWGAAPSAPIPSPPLSPVGPDVVIGCGCEECEDGECVCWGEGAECGGECACGRECGNRATQRGVGVRVRVVRSRRKGWGLVAAEGVRRGEFVCEYAGEYLTTEEARKRQCIYDELAHSGRLFPALLVVREHLPSGKACLRVNIDATKIGNVARFINHSCSGGNLSSVLVRNLGSLLPRLCFFAASDIHEGEELTFSYGETRIRQNGLPCFCGSSLCFVPMRTRNRRLPKFELSWAGPTILKAGQSAPVMPDQMVLKWIEGLSE